MHRDVLYESLMCVSRDDLDACQLAANILRDLIADHTTLPLRYIHLTTLEVLGDHGHVCVWRRLGGDKYQVDIPADAPDDYSLARLNNACVKFIRLRSGYDQSLPTFCDRMALFNFKVGQVSFGEHLQETETLDRTAKCLAEKLQVTSYELSVGGYGDPSTAMLPSALQHEVARSTILDLIIQISPGALTLPLFDLALSMNTKARLTLMFCAYNRAGAAWTGDFIQKFIVAEDTSRVPAVISVMQYTKPDDSLDAYLPNGCTVPRKRAIDAPDIHFIELPWDLVPLKSDLYAFRNATGGSELHVHAFKARRVSKNERNVYGEHAMLVMTTV